MEHPAIDELLNNDMSPLQLLDEYEPILAKKILVELFSKETVNIVCDENKIPYVSIGYYIPYHHTILDEIIYIGSKKRIFDGLVANIHKMVFEIEDTNYYLHVVISSRIKLLIEIVKYINKYQ